MNKIKFGTDGWRGVIAEDFTFKNVKIVGQAIADYIKEQKREKEGLVIGYDCRFLSREFAEAVSSVMGGNNIKIILSSQSLSTPALSYAVINEKCAGGIMLTASHNPPKFNGIKFKCDFGGSAPEEVTHKIESYLGKNKIKEIKQEQKQLIKEKELTSPYLTNLQSYLEGEIIEHTKLKVVYDSMFGVGAGYLEKTLKNTKIEIISLHQKSDPYFGGLNPEPIEENLRELKEKVKEVNADIGLAVDGDADRAGIIDEEGNYLPPHHVFPLLLLYLIEERNWKGGVAQTISLGYLSERIAQAYNLSFYETPIGFKYINKLMRQKEILLGGEESGGYGYGKYIPERDGVLTCLLFVEMMAKKRKKLSQILKDLEKKFGKSHFKREDLKLESLVDKEKLVKKIMDKAPETIANIPVKEIKTLDGIEFVLKDDSWLLIRPSGTEPKLRIYVESEKGEKVEAIIAEGRKLIC